MEAQKEWYYDMLDTMEEGGVIARVEADFAHEAGTEGCRESGDDKDGGDQEVQQGITGSRSTCSV